MGGGGGEGGGGVKEAEQREARFNLRTEDAGISLLQLRGGAKGGGLLECPPPAPRNLSHIERRARFGRRRTRWPKSLLLLLHMWPNSLLVPLHKWPNFPAAQPGTQGPASLQLLSPDRTDRPRRRPLRAFDRLLLLLFLLLCLCLRLLLLLLLLAEQTSPEYPRLR